LRVPAVKEPRARNGGNWDGTSAFAVLDPVLPDDASTAGGQEDGLGGAAVSSLLEPGKATRAGLPATGSRRLPSTNDSTGMALELSATGMKETPPGELPDRAGAPWFRQVDYTRPFLNLAGRRSSFHLRTGGTGTGPVQLTCSRSGRPRPRLYSYDELQRLMGESRTWNGHHA